MQPERSGAHELESFWSLTPYLTASTSCPYLESQGCFDKCDHRRSEPLEEMIAPTSCIATNMAQAPKAVHWWRSRLGDVKSLKPHSIRTSNRGLSLATIARRSRQKLICNKLFACSSDPGLWSTCQALCVLVAETKGYRTR